MGFSLLEMATVLIVIAILFGVAVPKYLSLNGAAGDRVEDGNIDTLRLVYTTKITEGTATTPLAPWPDLKGVTGYVPPAAPAPDEAPVLIDYSFVMRSLDVPQIFGLNVGGWMNTIPITEQMRCEDIKPNIKASVHYLNNSTSSSYVDSSFTLVSGQESATAVGSPVPKCNGWVRWVIFGSTANTPAQKTLWSAEPTLATMWEDGAWLRFSLFASKPDYTLSAVASGPSHAYVRDVPAAKWRMTCSGLSATHSVPYAISGASGNGTLLAQNTKEKSVWMDVAYGATTRTSFANPIIDVVEGVSPNPGAGAKCVRQGAAPVVPPSNPGILPLANDGSGICVAAGRKLPAWTDAAGTLPTSSISDTVKLLGKTAVADAVACPANLF